MGNIHDPRDYFSLLMTHLDAWSESPIPVIILHFPLESRKYSCFVVFLPLSTKQQIELFVISFLHISFLIHSTGLKMSAILATIDELCPVSAPFFGFMGVAASIVFASIFLPLLPRNPLFIAVPL